MHEAPPPLPDQVTPDPPPPAPSRPPIPSHDPIARASLVICTAAIVLIVLTVGLAARAAENLVKVYEDFDTELPSHLIIILGTPPWAMVLGGLVLITGMVAKERLLQSKAKTLYINVAVLLVAVAVFVYWRELQFAPMQILIQSLGGG